MGGFVGCRDGNGVPRKMTRTIEHLGFDLQERGKLQLPGPREGGRLSHHDTDERRLTEKANRESQTAVLCLQ